MTVDAPGQHVLERTSVLVDSLGGVEARFTVALPARGRTVLGQSAAAVLVQNLPWRVPNALCPQSCSVPLWTTIVAPGCSLSTSRRAGRTMLHSAVPYALHHDA